jgi:cytochrome P450
LNTQGTIDVDTIENMEYLDMVIKENLRKNPPAPFVTRIAAQQFVLNDAVTVEKGAAVDINLYAIHNNPNHWKDPEEFRPERFSKEESVGRHSHAWCPFGIGKRACIGNRFSILEQKIFLVNLLRKYKVEMHHVEYNFMPAVLTPKLGSIKVKLVRR